MSNLTAEQQCNCPNGSYSVKHTDQCYEAQIERLRRELETQVHREKHAKCLRCGHGLFETTLPESP